VEKPSGTSANGVEFHVLGALTVVRDGRVCELGADLTAIGTERGNRATPDGDGPMGVSRLRLSKPVIAFAHGRAALAAETISGAARFAAGAGRHGSYPG
jgi:hypothetical protein